MANFAYFEQLEQNIIANLSERKYKEAFRMCKEAIIKFPEESRFLKLKDKIEKAVEIENENLIKKRLEQIKPLWKEEKYLDIIKTLKDLLAASPNNNKLKDAYLEAEKGYRKQYEKLKQEFYKQQKERLDEVLEKNPGQIMEELFMLEKENPDNKDVKNLVIEFEDKLILKKIAEKKELLESNKYDVIDNFLDELRKIDKQNKHIKELDQSVKARKLESVTTQTQEYLYSGEKYLDTLMKLKKFDKAIQVCEEILRIKPNDQLAKELIIKAKEKYQNQLKYLTADSIKANLPKLQEEYKIDKNKFIRI